MFFATVYGPELESLFFYIHEYTHRFGGVDKEQLYSAFLPGAVSVKTKNLEDGLHFLKSASLIEGEKIYTSLLPAVDASLPFALLLLRQFRQIEQLSLQLPRIDYLYITLLDQLYISPNCMWIEDVHFATNQLELAREIGGVSKEKVGAWKRVMEFLGVGYRISSGFYCLYRPELLYAITCRWTRQEGTLQEYFEDHLYHWAPCLADRGEVALSIAYPLDQLARNKLIRLYTKQDSPSRPYFGDRFLRGIDII